MIGLRRGTVRVVPYNVAWAESFGIERCELEEIFGPDATRIEHIGSTAVPGLAAKPIIDIGVGLRDFSTWPQFVSQLEADGYAFMPERVSTEEVFFPKGPESRRTHYLHVMQYDSAEWRRVLTFRDALRQSESLREEYARLKNELAVKFADDRSAYSRGKIEFIEQVTKGGGE